MEQKLIKIFTAQDNIEAEMIIEILKRNHIPAIKEDLGNAGLMNLYGGNSKFGENIYYLIFMAIKADSTALKSYRRISRSCQMIC